MPGLIIEEIARVVGGEIVAAGAVEKDRPFVHFHFDTRSITGEDTLFFAIKSDVRDGHEFIGTLEGKRGTAAVVSREFDASGLTLPLIRVEDPLKAAQQLALHVRNTYRHIRYIGITGSAGKTTTKEFVYQILSHKYKAYRSFKNWNNWIGMPFSILNMKGDEDAAVFELAMSYPGIGEIDFLAEILRPDAAVILNAFPVHIEFLKNVDNVARAKSEILNYLEGDDIAFINGDLEHLLKRTRSRKGRKIYFGRDKSTNDIILKKIVRQKQGSTMVIDFFGIESRFETPIIHRVHLENLFIAIIVAQHIGMKHEEIREALKNIKPLSGRGDIRRHGSFTIIDETYNSNPEALKKALEWVNREFRGRKIVVVGDMLELGPKEDRFHRDIGTFFTSLRFGRLITVGKRALKIADGAEKNGYDSAKIHRFDNSADAGRFLKKIAKPGSVILFKASRGIQLEKAVEEFCADE